MQGLDISGRSRHAVRMSAAFDTLERMFEHGGVSSAAAALPAPGSTTERVRELQARIRGMQATRLDTRSMPTHPAIAGLLPGGGLRQGSVYSVERSAALLMLLLAAPSQAGAWCAVVGMPEFGVEAAARAGVDLARLVLVPHPGDQWLAVTAAVADVVGVVVTRPPRRAADSGIARLGARLRKHGTTLLVVGTWPQSDALLSIEHSRWHGIGAGHGHLAAREVTVTVSSRLAGRPRSARLWLPDADETVRRIDPVRLGPGRDGSAARPGSETMGDRVGPAAMAHATTGGEVAPLPRRAAG